MTPKHEPPFDIELHATIWRTGYIDAINDTMAYLSDALEQHLTPWDKFKILQDLNNALIAKDEQR